MARIIELTKTSDGVTVTPNIANESSTIIEIEVRPTKSYTTFPNSLFQLFLKDSGVADMPDEAVLEYWIEDVSGDQPIRLRQWQMGRFNNANQYNTEEQIRLDIDKSYKLAELRKILVKLTSSTVVDFTQAATDFRLQVERQG